MDPYKKLKLEFNGIKSVIRDYTSKGNISNFLNGLELGLEEDNIENTLYYLNEICQWYKINIGKIHANHYVFNSNEHDRNVKLLEEIKEELAIYDFSQILDRKAKSMKIESPKVFLSHSSSDRKYGDALQRLIVGMGVKNEQLIYTSHPLHKIPLNENIYEYLRKNINCNVIVIILWSNNYLGSPACLNEMGAAWVVQSVYTNMYTPDFSFGNPKYNECAVDTKKMGTILNGDAHCKASMIEFRNDLLFRFGLELEEQTWTYLLDQFLMDIS